jgi:hypothetical protein
LQLLPAVTRFPAVFADFAGTTGAKNYISAAIAFVGALHSF